jgi:hypothetical protein
MTNTGRQKKLHPWELCRELVAQQSVTRPQNTYDLANGDGNAVFQGLAGSWLHFVPNMTALPSPDDMTRLESYGVSPLSGLIPDLKTLYDLTGKGNYLEISLLVNSFKAYKDRNMHPHVIVLHENKNSNGADKSPDGKPNFWMLYHDDERHVKEDGPFLYTRMHNEPPLLNIQYVEKAVRFFSEISGYHLNSAGSDISPNFYVYHINGETGQRKRWPRETLLELPSIRQAITENSAKLYLDAAVMIDSVECLDKGLALQTAPIAHAVENLINYAAEKNASKVLKALIDCRAALAMTMTGDSYPRRSPNLAQYSTINRNWGTWREKRAKDNRPGNIP